MEEVWIRPGSLTCCPPAGPYDKTLVLEKPGNGRIYSRDFQSVTEFLRLIKKNSTKGSKFNYAPRVNLIS
jgi:hypothetical protein